MMKEYIRLTHDKGEARVKIENIASLKLFESAGFRKTYYILEYRKNEENEEEV